MRILRSYQSSLLISLLMFMTGVISLSAQNYTLDNKQSEITIFGTSNIHDWEIVVEQQQGTIVLEEGNGTVLKAMKIEIPVTSLKSGKSGMDKNTYKAMKADDFANVTFTLTTPVTLQGSGNTYKVTAKGDLSISGVTKATDLVFTLTKTAGGLNLEGEKSLDMTTYDITPPSALMGTIKTGKDVTLKFKTTLLK